MIRLNQAVIVEGKYDAIKLSSIIDALIITTDGFSIFKDKEKLNLIRTMAKKTGIIIITDSDMAGFKIRNYIKGAITEGDITNVYIPDIFGKEKRKELPSKEGKLGLEGMEKQIILEALQKAGVLGVTQQPQQRKKVDKPLLFELSLTGTPDSSQRRRKLYKALSLPSRLSTNSFIQIVNATMDYEQFIEVCKKTFGMEF